MRKTAFFLLALSFFTSCSKVDSLTNPFKNEVLAYTQKFEYINAKTRYLSVGVYLNPIDPNLKDREKIEYFILSTYPKDIQIKPNSIKVNNKIANIKDISKSDKFIKYNDFDIPYSNSYLITLPSIKADELSLSYQTQNDINVTLKFRKISRSMYWMPGLKLKD